jgi:hypothetical protein
MDIDLSMILAFGMMVLEGFNYPRHVTVMFSPREKR